MINLIFKKLELLKKNVDNEIAKNELSDLEDQLFLIKSKCQNKTEEDVNILINTGGFLNKLNTLAANYAKNIQSDYNKIIIAQNDKEKEKTCPKCNLVLIKIKEGLCCDQCGFVEQVANIYYGERKYKPSKLKDSSTDHYCEEWLNNLQGKGLVNLPNDLLLNLINECRNICVTKNPGKIKEYDLDLIRQNVCLGLVSNIKCSQIRKWLSKYNGSKYNKFVPTIHRKLTRDLGNEIIPPQFNLNEERVILNDWKLLSETYCEQYKNLKQKTSKKKNNNPYYPVCILLIVNKRFNDSRASKLQEYIHTQSVDTYNLRLQCWEKTCKILNYNPEFYTE